MSVFVEVWWWRLFEASTSAEGVEERGTVPSALLKEADVSGSAAWLNNWFNRSSSFYEDMQSVLFSIDVCCRRSYLLYCCLKVKNCY